MKDRLRAALAFLEERSGVGALLRRLGATPLPEGVDGPRWRLTAGPVLLLIVLLQIATGITLAIYYSPGTTSAWGSVFHIEQKVLLGSFVRGLHAFGAGAVVIAFLVYGLEAGLRRAYREPHQLSWWLGLAIVPVLAGFALTGYLLPWDQRGYWATQVAAGITAGTPLVGDMASRVFRGGSDLGNLTLTRFYALHIAVLPATLLLLIGVHLAVWRRNAVRAAGDATAPRPGIWPGQVLRSLVVFLVVVAVLAGLASAVGAGLDAPADPESDYPPRPEWYFAPLRELLKYVPEPWGSLVVPGLVFAALAAIPLLDRRGEEERAAGRLKLARALLVVPLVGWLALLGVTFMKDAGDGEFQKKKAAAAADAQLAKQLAAEGIPAAGAGAMLRNHPPRRGARLFEEHCNECHTVGGKGGEGGADLTNYGSVAWIRGLILDPDHPKYFGKTKHKKHPEDARMPKLDAKLTQQAAAIATFVRSLDPGVEGLDPERVAAGREAYFKAAKCGECHSIKPWTAEVGADAGPNLHGYGSAEWLRAFLVNPKSERFYHELSHMPAYGKDLTGAELDALVVFLRGLSGK